MNQTSILLPSGAKDFSKTLFFIKAISISILIAVSAQISLPLQPVPMTLQPLSILIIGLCCHPALAIASVAFYITEGSLGFPVFQGLSGGFHHLWGPTAGYIFGFLPSVAIVSYLKKNENNFWYSFAICSLAKIILFSLGITWLSLFVGFNHGINFGLVPFVWKIPVEIAFAILSARLIKTFINKIQFKE